VTARAGVDVAAKVTDRLAELRGQLGMFAQLGYPSSWLDLLAGRIEELERVQSWLS
jgi:hypothetical protein